MRRIALVSLFVGCGGAGPDPAAPLDHETTAEGVTRVYAWDGTELVGLYCGTPNGLETEACDWPSSLTLPLDPAQELRLDVHTRVQADDSQITVRAYSEQRHAELVIVSDAGTSMWSREGKVDKADVTLLPIPDLVPGVKQKQGQPADPNYVVHGYSVTPLVAIDLDRDGVAEVIYQSDDDGGDFVGAQEFGPEGGFATRSGG